MNKKIRIAFVDDSAFQRSMIKHSVKKNRTFDLQFTCSNGVELMEKLEECPELPHICLIDLHMPEMNGIEAAQKVTKHYPFVMLFGYTNSVDESELLRFRESGLITLFTKGDIKFVLEEIQRIVNENHSVFDRDTPL